MVSELDADQTEGVGYDPKDEGSLDPVPKNSMETGRRINEEGNPNQESHSYKDQRVDSRVKFLEEKMMTRTRDVEERMGQRAGLMESRIGSMECILKNLELKMVEDHAEIKALFQKLTLGLKNMSAEKLGDETVIRGEASRSGQRYTLSARGNAKSSQGKNPRIQLTNCTEGKFPLPKNPKVNILIFKGDGDILNWLYQLEHIFSIHETLEENRVEFYKFYLQGDALLWWRWIEKQK